MKLRPGLKNDQNFVYAYIAKLHPTADSNWRQDRKELQAYLDRLWAYVSTLDPVFNSLKAHVLYHRLVLDRSQGVYDLERFLAYLKLPRGVFYAAPVLRDGLEQRTYPADLNADFTGVTALAPVGADEPIVRSYLAHFLVEAENYDQFQPYVEENYLKHLFAEVKIVNGLGDAERWASLLPPEQYRALKERIDIDFAETNKTEYGPNEAVGLDVFVKNVETLLVKVFEINTNSYYRQYGREVGPDVDLDGLVANHEQTFNYNESPLRRVKRHYEFPMLKDRGVYVIDFIGNGMSSRAVVRKGKLEYLVRTSAAGSDLHGHRRAAPAGAEGDTVARWHAVPAERRRIDRHSVQQRAGITSDHPDARQLLVPGPCRSAGRELCLHRRHLRRPGRAAQPS